MVAEYSDAAVRLSVPEDAEALAAGIRPEDLREVRALRTEPLVPLLRGGIEMSKTCYTALTGSGELAMVFGVVPHPVEEQTGIVWLLGTKAMEDIQYRFIRTSKEWLDRLYGDRYEILFNIADKRNTLHLSWLQWLGFKFMQEVEAGLNKEPFIQFQRTKDV